MKFLRDIEILLANKLLPLWVYAAGLLLTVTTPLRLTDHTHEIQIIGSAWFRGGSIPLVQAYSNFGPLNLFIGAYYDRFITNNFSARIFEIVAFSLMSVLLYKWLMLMHKKSVSYRNTLLLVSLLMISIPGVWQVGINPGKIGLLLLIGCYYTFAKWRSSGKSYWLLGETTKNWRYLLATGILLSGLVFTSFLITLFAIPIFAQLIRVIIKDWQYGLRQSLFIFVPLLLHGWVWYSFFYSRQLVSEALRSMSLDFGMATHSTGFSFVNSMIIIFPILVLLVLSLMAIRRDNFKKDRHTWVIGLGVLEGLIVSRGGILLTLPLIFLLAAPLFIKKLKLGYVAVWCFLGLLLVIPYRFFDSSTAKLEKARAEVASVYVEQRMIDTRYVLYYGRGAGFFERSDLTGSSRYYNAAIFSQDNDDLQLVDKFRGDNEANAPMFVVYATSETSKIEMIARIEEYFAKHYDEVTTLNGYKILKRK